MRALLLGYYGAQNLGDDMMLACISNWLSSQGINITVISENPCETRTRFRLNTIRNATLLCEWAWFDSWFRGHAIRLIRAICSHDFLLVGGGDLIRADRGWRVFWYTMEKIVFALLIRKPVYLLNIGIGRPNSTWSCFVLRWALRRCQRLIVRDTRSYNICSQFALLKKTYLVDDIVLHLSDFSSCCLTRSAKRINHTDPSYAVICLRNDPNVFQSYDVDDCKLMTFAASLDALSDKYRINFVFLPFQNREEGGDNIVHTRIASHMIHKDRVEIREWSGDFAEVLDCIRNARFLVGMRLHSIVVAVGLGIPVVIMPYDIKVIEFAKSIGSSNLIFDSDLLSKETLVAHFERALSDNAKYDIQSRTNWKGLVLTGYHASSKQGL